MGETFDRLKLGSDSFNQDKADIQWLVSMLKGIMESAKDSLPEDFSFGPILYTQDQEEPFRSWKIEFSLFVPKKNRGPREVVVTLVTFYGGSEGRIPWDQVNWSLLNDLITPKAAEVMAGNLGELLLDALLALSEVGAEKVVNAIECLLERGDRAKGDQDTVS